MKSQKLVWIVDDSPMALQAAVGELSGQYRVMGFSDGASVIERAASGDLPDLLVLDWVMPGVSGSEVLRFLRASKRTEGLPILVLTASGGSDLVEALEAGADDFVGKACSRAELLARVGALVRSSELRERAERAERELAVLLESEREARAEAEAANDIKDDFLATLSHELRTPLNSIVGWTSLLRNGTLPPETASRALATIERNAKAQAAIIEDLLDISRIVTGKLRLDLVEIDPTDAAAQALETVRPAATAKKVHLVSKMGKVPPISGDASRIQQIVWNLLSNAVRFTPAGGTVTLAVEMVADSQARRDGEPWRDDAGIRISVTDTGEGIAPDLLPRVFDRFRQGDSSTTRANGGLGLGLAIVRHITELHGGRVSVTSDGPGRGARFEVWLPLASVADVDVADPRVGAATAASSLDGIRVLVVEDDADSLELVQSALAMRGAIVTPTSNGQEALAALDAGTNDVLVADIMMPEMDGYSLIRAVRARDAERGGRTPAIALSAAARDTDRKRALAAGFQTYVAKPVDIGSLASAIVRTAASTVA